MLLIELNSISNMGCQKIKVVRSLRYSGYLLRDLNEKTKTKKILKKNIGILVFENLKNKNTDFLNSNMC